MMKLDIQLFAEGRVVIEAEVDIKSLEKDLKEALKELKQYQKEAEDLTKQRLENEAKQEEFKRKKQKLKQDTERKIREQEYKNGGPLTDIEYEGIEATYDTRVRQLKNDYAEVFEENDRINQKIKENADAQAELNEKIKRAEQLLERQKKAQDMQSVLKNVGKELERNIKKVVRWSLAIFGIRTAYNAVRNAISVISQNDEQLATDIEYMKNALAYTMEPIVRAIVNLAKELLNYVAYIAKIFGLNIFENANKSLKGANKQAKALQKTMASFDEMNVLQDSSSSGGGGAVGPSFDLTMPSEPPEWLTRLPAIIAGIATALGLLKLGELANQLGLIKGNLTGIQALGIGIAITGLIWTIQDLIKFLNDPTFDNFIAILRSISIAIIGIGIAVGSLPTIIAGIIAGIIYVFLKNYDTIMQKLRDFDKFMVWLWYKIKELFGPVGQMIFAPFMLATIMIRHAFEDLLTSLKRIVNGIVMIFKGDLKGGVKEAFGGLVDIVKRPLNRIIDYLNQVIRGLNKVQIDMPDWLGGGKFGFNISTIPRLARGGIVNNPGRGVMMGNYIAGENGAEAVLPLTDDTLQKLANMIPITINLTNTMNGRVISRELQRVQNENDFAYNR